MKDRIAIGGVIGVLLAVLGWQQHQPVEPHTTVFLPGVMIIVLPVAFLAMTWMIARRHQITSPSTLTTTAVPYIMATLVPYIAMLAIVAYRNSLSDPWMDEQWTRRLFWVASGVVTGGAVLLPLGMIVSAIAARVILWRKHVAT